MSQVVYAKESCWLTDQEGLGYQVSFGSSWDADDPLVKRHPKAFSAEPTLVMRTQPLVEQATHAPGEVRPKRVG